MKDALPEWYPLANATDDEIDAWLVAAVPPYVEMRAALPRLNEKHQFEAWIDGVREARASIANPQILAALLPSAIALPLPPRRAAGRQ